MYSIFNSCPNFSIFDEIWLNIKDIKKWRWEKKYKIEYKSLVIDEYENIIDSLESLPQWIKYISNFNPEEKLPKLFLYNKKKYNKLDSNDVNHYMLCKEHSLDWILTCDSDFKQINDNDIKIIVIDNKFKLYT